MSEALFRALHMLALLGVAAGMVIAILVTRPTLSRDDVDGLTKTYLMTLIALTLTTVAGLALWLWVGKPAAFFSNNPVFHAKIGLVVILAILLLVPALFFYRENKSGSEEAVSIPLPVRIMQRTAIPLIIVLPVLAYLMARGIGY
jgi:putative membrane protein